MMWDNGGSSSWWPMALILFGFCAVVAAFAAYMVNGTGRWHRASECGNPLGTTDRLLAERLAAGHIDAEEYQRSLALIHQAKPTTSQTRR